MLRFQVKDDAAAVAASGSTADLFRDVCVCIRTVWDGLDEDSKPTFRAAITEILATPDFWDLPIKSGTLITGPAAAAACKKIFSKEGQHGEP